MDAGVGPEGDDEGAEGLVVGGEGEGDDSLGALGWRREEEGGERQGEYTTNMHSFI